MSELAQDKNFINQGDVDFRSAISEALAQKIGSSINWVNGSNGLSLGSIVWSHLDLVDFQSQYGSDWVLSDGSSIVGTDLESVTGESNSPDLIGKYIRGLDNGRGIDTGRVLNSSQSANMIAHWHQQYANQNITTNFTGNVTQPFVTSFYKGVGTTQIQGKNGGTALQNSFTSTDGGDAIPKTVDMYPYIRINE